MGIRESFQRGKGGIAIMVGAQSAVYDGKKKEAVLAMESERNRNRS